MLNTISEIIELKKQKGKDYKNKDNPFRVFYKASKMRRITMMEALDMFRLKHEISIWDIINSPNATRYEVIKEKFNDYIIYSIMLFGLIKNERKLIKNGNESYFNKFVYNLREKEMSIVNARNVFQNHATDMFRRDYEKMNEEYFVELVSALVEIKNYETLRNY